MADISQEVEQLRNAVYGEEVRGAFISCMEKINDDNESYQAIKESVDASAEKVEQQVEEIDTKTEEVEGSIAQLTAKITEANTSKTNLDNSKKAADTSKANLDASVKTAGESKTALDTSIEDAREAKAALDGSISSGNTTKTNLDNSKKAADTSKANLDASKEAADNAKSSLDQAIENAGTAEESLESATGTANTARTNLESATEDAQDAKTAVDQSTSDAESKKQELEATIQRAEEVEGDIAKVVQDAVGATNSANQAASLANQAAATANAATSAAVEASETAESAAQTATQAAGAASSAAQTANQAAQGADTARDRANSAAGVATEAAAEALKQATAAADAAELIRDDCYPMLFRDYDGKVYSVFFADPADTMVPTGTKQDDNADIPNPVPSTDTVRNENPYDEIPLFRPIECNGYVDEEGEPHITAVKGEPTFRTDGSNGDVCIALKTGYIRTIIDPDGSILGQKGQKISVTDSWQEGFIPYTAAIRPDGTVRPYVLIPKYQAVDYDGAYYSLPGYSPVYNVSHNNQITNFRKRGTQYCGETCADAEIWETLFHIVFATLHSQSIMSGCTSYSFQYTPAVTEENVERFIVTNSQAANILVGSTVSIGDQGGNASADRGNSYMHSLVNRKKVTKKEALEDGANTAIYVDNDGVPFNVTETCKITSMPWYTGSTDSVKGTCGSPNNNTNQKNPFKFLGIEFALGQYIVRSDVILNGVYSSEEDTYEQEIHTCFDCTQFATAINEHYKKVGYAIPDSGNTWKYISELGYDINFPHIRMASKYGADSSKRYADACHTGSRSNGTREFLSLGTLYNGTIAGLRLASLDSSLSLAYWGVSARPSYTGRRGSVVDWAETMGVNLGA